MRAPSLRPSLLLLLVVATPTQARTPGDDAPTETAEARGGTIHLASLLDEAQISSPLLELEPAPNVDALEGADRLTLLAETFEDFDWDFAGWQRTPAARIDGPEGERNLRIVGIGNASRLSWARVAV